MWMQTRFFVVIQLLCLMLLVLVIPAYAQARWDGADNLPVNPLTCPGEEADTAETLPFRYDGAQPVNAPNLTGQPIVVVDARQPVSDGYDRALERGMNTAAGELGNVQLISGVSSVVGVSQQGALDEFVARGVNGILFAAADQEDIASSLRTALQSGIRVIGYGADTERNAREWFVQPAAYNALAKVLIDNYVQQTGPNVGFAILTTTFDSPQAGRWISEMWAYASQCYPDLEWLETVETQGDAVLAYNQAAVLLGEYSSDMNGFISVTTMATPNAAQAIAQSNQCGSRVVVGLATPNDMKPAINSGCVQSAVLWNPADLGYAAVYVMRAVADGTLQPGATAVDAGRLGTLPVVNGSEIVLGPPLIINARNINDLNF
jgi:ABC-type sugar transport system substrate-binding protein